MVTCKAALLDKKSLERIMWTTDDTIFAATSPADLVWGIGFKTGGSEALTRSGARTKPAWRSPEVGAEASGISDNHQPEINCA